MLQPRTVTVHLDHANKLCSNVLPESNAQKYMHAMKVLQQRTGKAPRAALDNFVPTFISSFAGPLVAAPISGRPHHLQAEYQAVTMNDHECVLFLKAGDQYILRVSADPKPVDTFLSCTYDLSPTLLTAPTYEALRNPIDQVLLDQDARAALQLAQSRELNMAELFLVSRCLPALWAKHGAPTTPSISSPTDAQVKICTTLAHMFSDPIGKLSVLADTSPEWRIALSQYLPPSQVKEEADEPPSPSSRPRMRM
ncbi:hypothetical protein ACTOWA_00205 [Herbaspirillum seropedicae]|uniref:hypothetical protein n=1 Tax=Herbaspirillum seropedicae TaxID=964 RepID=UPI0028565BCF|nr:hypothetical protein [Herbaspirillum seropedicae]MDR6397990.1 hypothetical protein [Herbaspirillum seropedicae]